MHELGLRLFARKRTWLLIDRRVAVLLGQLQVGGTSSPEGREQCNNSCYWYIRKEWLLAELITPDDVPSELSYVPKIRKRTFKGTPENWACCIHDYIEWQCQTKTVDQELSGGVYARTFSSRVLSLRTPRYGRDLPDMWVCHPTTLQDSSSESVGERLGLPCLLVQELRRWLPLASPLP